MQKQVTHERPDQTKHPRNKKVASDQTNKRFTEKGRKGNDSKQRSLGGF